MKPARLEPFELFAVKYATNSGRKLSDNRIGGDIHEAASDLDYFVWVARNSSRVFVIDTGFAQAQADERKRTLLRAPAEALKLIGVDAGAVDQVILTHLHFDHAGTLDDFPRACFHVQDSEVAYATGRCMCHPFLRHPYSVEDVTGLVRKVYAGRVTFHAGTSELAPGLTLHRTGGHSGGLQVARVFTRRGWVVVASDASHLYSNMQRGVPFPAVHNIEEMLEGFRIIHQLADSPEHVVPGHDPLVMKIYPALSKKLAGIVVRLDEAPAPLP